MSDELEHKDGDSPGIAAKKARLRAARATADTLSTKARNAKADTLRNVRGTEKSAADSANTTRLAKEVMQDGAGRGVKAMFHAGMKSLADRRKAK